MKNEKSEIQKRQMQSVIARALPEAIQKIQRLDYVASLREARPAKADLGCFTPFATDAKLSAIELARMAEAQGGRRSQ